MAERTARCFMYSPDCLEGRIFAGAEAIEAAYKDGWVDSPAAVTTEEPAPKAPPKKRAPAGGKKAATRDDSK
jgi:hypothetical protein